MNYILVEALPFCAQTRTFLMMSGIDTIDHLIEMSEEQISSMDHISQPVMQEIISFKKMVDHWTEQGIEVRYNQLLNEPHRKNGYSVINHIYPETTTNTNYEIFIQNKDGEYVWDCMIEELDLSKRVKNSLMSYGIMSVKEAMNLDYDLLSDIRKLGEKSKTELMNYLKKHTAIRMCA